MKAIPGPEALTWSIIILFIVFCFVLFFKAQASILTSFFKK